MCLSIYLSVCLSINLSIYQSINLSIYSWTSSATTYLQTKSPYGSCSAIFFSYAELNSPLVPGRLKSHVWSSCQHKKKSIMSLTTRLSALADWTTLFCHFSIFFPSFSFVTCTKATDWDVWGVVIACRGARSAAFPLRVPPPTKQGTSTAIASRAIASRAKNGSSTRRDMLSDASGLRAGAKRCGDEGG